MAYQYQPINGSVPSAVEEHHLVGMRNHGLPQSREMEQGLLQTEADVEEAIGDGNLDSEEDTQECSEYRGPQAAWTRPPAWKIAFGGSMLAIIAVVLATLALVGGPAQIPMYAYADSVPARQVKINVTTSGLTPDLIKARAAAAAANAVSLIKDKGASDVEKAKVAGREAARTAFDLHAPPELQEQVARIAATESMTKGGEMRDTVIVAGVQAAKAAKKAAKEGYPPRPAGTAPVAQGVMPAAGGAPARSTESDTQDVKIAKGEKKIAAVALETANKLYAAGKSVNAQVEAAKAEAKKLAVNKGMTWGDAVLTGVQAEELALRTAEARWAGAGEANATQSKKKHGSSQDQAAAAGVAAANSARKEQATLKQQVDAAKAAAMAAARAEHLPQAQVMAVSSEAAQLVRTEDLQRKKAHMDWLKKLNAKRQNKGPNGAEIGELR
eukprot:TRINITY_DN24178_c0_g1_i1.p1 TRINITY_DN24178_c0_g1~~TRINITY_DN24178_c0_g1_i1.p1  ORF type:complete len:467 (-),score=127.43 TRINITY_DN24178_c0_g1_i1:320-1642(-)